MAPTVNKDVEETRRLEKDARNEMMRAAELMSIALIDEAAEGRASNIMEMLDMVAARIIRQVSKDFGMDTDKVVKLHADNVHNTIRKLNERK